MVKDLEFSQGHCIGNNNKKGIQLLDLIGTWGFQEDIMDIDSNNKDGKGYSFYSIVYYIDYWNRSPPSLADICVRDDTEAGLRRGCLFSVSFKLYVAVYVLKRSPPPCPASVSALTHMSAREWGDLFHSSPCKWTTRIVMTMDAHIVTILTENDKSANFEGKWEHKVA